MYQYLDRPIQTLDFHSRFFVWAARNWVDANCHQRCPCSILGPAFLKWNMSEALPDFFIAMAHLNEGAKQQLVFGQTACGKVHEIEAILLSMQREMLAGNQKNCARVVDSLVGQDAVAGFLTAMQRYCEHVQGSSLGLAQLPHTTSRHDMS